MNRKRLFKVVGVLFLVAGGLWLFRYQVSFGPYFANYDIIVTDTVNGGPALEFGSHSFMAGAFQGNAVNIGISVPIPDSARFEFGGEAPYLDPKYITLDSLDGHEIYNGPPVVDSPSNFVKVPIRSRLPKRSPLQKYAFHFTIFPQDSVGLEILLLSKGDCSHLPPTAATAIMGPGPCAY